MKLTPRRRKLMVVAGTTLFLRGKKVRSISQLKAQDTPSQERHEPKSTAYAKA